MRVVEKVQQEEQVGEVCFTLNTIWPPLRFNDDIKAIINTVAQSLDTKYGKRVFVCVRKSVVEVYISNDYIEHIDTCRTACMDAFEVLKRNQEGYVSACHEYCRKHVMMTAFESLDATCAKIEEELKLMGLKYKTEYERGKYPQHLKITVWL